MYGKLLVNGMPDKYWGKGEDNLRCSQRCCGRRKILRRRFCRVISAGIEGRLRRTRDLSDFQARTLNHFSTHNALLCGTQNGIPDVV